MWLRSSGYSSANLAETAGEVAGFRDVAERSSRTASRQQAAHKRRVQVSPQSHVVVRSAVTRPGGDVPGMKRFPYRSDSGGGGIDRSQQQQQQQQ
ncbi:hypothetical protein Q7P36_001672 [Cladosporium allicinum]